MHAWGMKNSIEQDPILGDGDLALFEHLIHEVAHAQLLDIPEFDRTTSNRISDLLSEDKEGFMPTSRAIQHEEIAWAIGWLCWQTFKIDFEWGDLDAQAEIQYADSENIAAYLEEPRIQQLAEATEREIRRLCKLSTSLGPCPHCGSPDLSEDTVVKLLKISLDSDELFCPCIRFRPDHPHHHIAKSRSR